MMIRRLTPILSCLMLLLNICFPANAQQTSNKQLENEPNVVMRILPERGTIKAGETLWIGLEQSIKPHWHTYWQNPGDSGAPPRIEWTLPEGFSVSEIYWPAPIKIPYDPLLNYGYENNVILLQKLTAPKTLPQGEIQLTAAVDVLVCKEECIPESDDFEIMFNGTNAALEDNESYLALAKEKLPRLTQWNASYKPVDGDIEFTITPSSQNILTDFNINSASLFPVDWGLIDNATKSKVSTQGNQLIIKQTRGNRDLTEIGDIDTVLTLGMGNSKTAYAINIKAPPQNILKADQKALETKDKQETTQTNDVSNTIETSLITALLLAFAGGIILNLMPCVFPVLSLKAIKLVKMAHDDTSKAKISGLAYTAGIIVTFVLIAGILIALKTAGAQIGWGFQLQTPIIVGGLAYLLFAIGLNLFGLFEIGTSLTNMGGKTLQGKSGASEAFFTGVLATIVATPCTAPFMAGASGYAFTQPAIIALIIFITLGLGLAFPYLLLSFLPNLGRYLPKPGMWMDTFKQAMAFPILLSAVWLIWVLSKQSGSLAVLLVLIGMVSIAFVIWFARIAKNKKTKTSVTVLGLILASAALIAMPSYSGYSDAGTVKIDISDNPNWEKPYSETALEEALNTGKPVFVEMTAAWCISCKVNHATSINTNGTKKVFTDNEVIYISGDWTNQDAAITQYLKAHGRSGVPLYVFYGAKDENGDRPEKIILPQILTPGIIRKTVTK